MDLPTRRYGGTGLGLALVRDIVNAHGSVIEVESEQGKGSTFSLPPPGEEKTGMKRLVEYGQRIT